MRHVASMSYAGFWMTKTPPILLPHCPVMGRHALVLRITIRNHSRYGGGQWETTLLYNVVYHWLCPFYPKSLYRERVHCTVVGIAEWRLWNRNEISDPLLYEVIIHDDTIYWSEMLHCAHDLYIILQPKYDIKDGQPSKMILKCIWHITFKSTYMLSL